MLTLPAREIVAKSANKSPYEVATPHKDETSKYKFVSSFNKIANANSLTPYLSNLIKNNSLVENKRYPSQELLRKCTQNVKSPLQKFMQRPISDADLHSNLLSLKTCTVNSQNVIERRIERNTKQIKINFGY